MTAPVPLPDADLAAIEARAEYALTRVPLLAVRADMLQTVLPEVRRLRADNERLASALVSLPVEIEDKLAHTENALAAARRELAALPGRIQKPVNTWTATEECRAHTDAALEAEEQRREAGK